MSCTPLPFWALIPSSDPASGMFGFMLDLMIEMLCTDLRVCSASSDRAMRQKFYRHLLRSCCGLFPDHHQQTLHLAALRMSGQCAYGIVRPCKTCIQSTACHHSLLLTAYQSIQLEFTLSLSLLLGGFGRSCPQHF